MSINAPIMLDDNLDAFVEGQVRDGRYASANDVVVAGLQLLREDDTRLEALRAALQEGEDSGDPVEFDFDEFLALKRAQRLER